MRRITIAGSVLASALLGWWPAPVPLRPLGAITARATEPLAGAISIRPLPDGRVFVSDPGHRRLILFDSTLARFTVVADTSSTSARRYGRGSPRVFAYGPDSTFLVDDASLALLVIDGDGAIRRVIAAPSPEDAPLLNGTPGAMFDGRRGLLYRAAMPSPAGSFDTAFIVRADLISHRVDTVARVHVGFGMIPSTSQTPEGVSVMIMRLTAPVARDDWAVLDDGSVAVLRAQDYHVDWFDQDGKASASPRIDHEWVRRSDADKAAVVAGLQAQADRQNALNAASNAKNARMISRAEVGTTLDDVQDYAPPFVTGARGDLDNNLWVLTKATDSTGGATYDVINRAGRLVDRVQLPGGCTLAGFGRGVAYLTSREGTGISLARARLR